MNEWMNDAKLYNAFWLDTNKLQITNHTPFVSFLFVILFLISFLHFVFHLRLFDTFLTSESKYYLEPPTAVFMI
jgi:hypothetical protein